MNILCSCGGYFYVIRIEEYPRHLNEIQKVNYMRKCTVRCDNCGKIVENQPYD